MNNEKIQLTEQDIHFLVEEAVKEYMIQEGLWGGMKNLTQRGTQAMKTSMSNMGKGIANKAQNAYNTAKSTVSNAYNNVKTAYQQGSAQQDIQNVNKALQPMVQKGILGQKQYNTILGMLNKAMQAQGGQRMQGFAQA